MRHCLFLVLFALAACKGDAPPPAKPPVAAAAGYEDPEVRRFQASKLVVDLGLLTQDQATICALGQIWEQMTIRSLEERIAARPEEASGAHGELLAEARRFKDEWMVDYGSVALTMLGGDRQAYRDALLQAAARLDRRLDIYETDILDDKAFRKRKLRYCEARVMVAQPCAKFLSDNTSALRR